VLASGPGGAGLALTTILTVPIQIRGHRSFAALKASNEAARIRYSWPAEYCNLRAARGVSGHSAPPTAAASLRTTNSHGDWVARESQNFPSRPDHFANLPLSVRHLSWT